MLTQTEIKKWSDIATLVFRNFMPDINRLPEIHIVTDKIIIKRRAEIAERLKAPQRDINLIKYEALMEMVHGECGDAIIIRQVPLNDLLKKAPEYEVFRSFCILFWHEMGHFYAIDQEKTDLHRFNDAEFEEEDFDTFAKQEGYWFWAEFIAQSIAFHVDFLNCSINNKENYHPERIQWTPEVEEFISEKLVGYLDLSFDEFMFTINSSALSMYFAQLFKDDLTTRYIKAAEEDGPLSDDELIELTMIYEMDPEYHDTLLDMYKILKKQMEKERFWEIDEQWLLEIGKLIIELESNTSCDTDIDLEELMD